MPVTLGRLLEERIDALVAAVLEGEQGVRDDAPGSVHDLRVAARRLRSLLVTYRPVLDRGRTDPLREELGWLTAVLGEVRDREVLLERVVVLLSEMPFGVENEQARARLTTTLAEEHHAARRALVEALDSARFLHLVDALRALGADPPVGTSAEAPAGMLARRRVRHDWRRLEALVRDLPAGPQRARALARPAPPPGAQGSEAGPLRRRDGPAGLGPQRCSGCARRRLASRRRLGAHQDALVLEEYAGRLGRRPPRDGRGHRHLRRLARVAATEAERLAAGFPALWERLELSRRPRRGPAGR